MALANSTGVIGFTSEVSTVKADFAQGTDVIANGTTYTYVKAGASIAPAGTVALTGAFGATTTTTGSTYASEVPITVPAGEFLWVKQVTSPL